MSKPKISLCMIMRNEEALLDQCLASVQGLVSEIIIVDTGSEDRSIAIAEKRGALVYHMEWEDDFSTPRNFGIEKAKGDWILVLDADEALHPSSFAEIQKACLFPQYCYFLTQRHYIKDPCIHGFVPCRGEFPEMEQDSPGYFESSLVRLFPSNPNLRYRNRIHELVEPSIQDNPQFSIKNSGVRIHHYGPLKPKKQKDGKAKLYTDLGVKKASEYPKDWKALYELGVEHNCNGRHEESAQAFAESAKLNPNYLELWINYGYVLCELGRRSQAAVALEKALRLNPNSAEAWCNLGVVYLRSGRFLLAIDAFKAALRHRKDYVNAWTNLGDACLNAAVPSAAIQAFENALTLVPKNSKAEEGLGIAAFMMGNFARAESLLTKHSSSERANFWLQQLYRLRAEASPQKVA